MNVLIITIHNIHNFGSVFQTYALYKKLTDMGHSTTVLNYNPRYFRIHSLKTYIGQTLYAKSYLTRKNKFSLFVSKAYKISKENYKSKRDLDKRTPKADVYIAGGDQLWNPFHDCGRDDVYKLTFTNGAKISYGTSLGKENFTDHEILDLSSKISSFRAVSVRESSSVELLASAGIEAIHVVDPVLLLEKRDYDRCIKKVDLPPFLFVYLVTPSPLLEKTMNYISSNLGLKIVMCAGLSQKGNCDYLVRDAGPEEILSYIACSKFVLSASFHATLFSILYHKKFVSILPHEQTNERIVDFLSWTGLSTRIISNSDELQDDLFDDIDFSFADSAIESKRIDSIDFLTSNLGRME